jgi:Sec-independent protein translocase protein TatA
MEIFNIGPFEFLLILVIALIVLGPERMVNTAKQAGKMLHTFIQSPYWASIVRTTQEIRNIPRKIVQEAGLEESMEEFNRLRAQSFEEDLDSYQDPKNRSLGSLPTQPPDLEQHTIMTDPSIDTGNPVSTDEGKTPSISESE